ncbi:MAG: bifunctional pyr operon transcriptional regulator/uracil phosphoribosyltransferase PyrR [Desulfovibrio sp.]|jgi:pyrimidine operon attenuation protein/uracil phosphoribosyltransferase|nr:bifunctional pyr operon transcriptional regulator/uracil phosphoribosyltransferase PyrR [Desulfovibrio sp.]
MTAKTLLGEKEISAILEELASQVLTRHPDCGKLVLVGIQRRGADIALRLAALLADKIGYRPPIGTLDINFYRDDWTTIEGKPQIGLSKMPSSVDDGLILLVDDVLFTGRTVRAALEALLDYGRPSVVELLVLIDRGHRELPIQADYTGRVVPTTREARVDVLLKERDGEDSVRLVS